MQDRNGKKGLYSHLIVSCSGRIYARLPGANASVSLLRSLPFATQQPIAAKPTTALGELSSPRQGTKPCIYKHGAWAHVLMEGIPCVHKEVGEWFWILQRSGDCSEIKSSQLEVKDFFFIGSSDASGCHFGSPCRGLCLHVSCCYHMLSLGQLRTRGRNNAIEPSKKYISDACIIPQEAIKTLTLSRSPQIDVVCLRKVWRVERTKGSVLRCLLS